jgi:hypothetical protein
MLKRSCAIRDSAWESGLAAEGISTGQSARYQG